MNRWHGYDHLFNSIISNFPSSCPFATYDVNGQWERFPKLIKMLVLYIKINFNQSYINFFPRNKATVVLNLALLASHVAETLIENLRKTSEYDVIFAKQRPPNTPHGLV